MTSQAVHFVMPFLLMSSLMAESFIQESWRKVPHLVVSKRPREVGLWHVFGVIHCGVVCGQGDHCNSFQYSFVTRTCSGFRVFRPPGVTDRGVVNYGRNVSCSEDPGYELHGTRAGVPMCFKYIKEKVTWGEARERCHADGAELIIPDSKEKADFLFEYVKSVNPRRSYSTWIGLVKETHDEKIVYRWLNNSTDIAWGKGEPDPRDNQECGEIDSDGISDMQCYRRRIFICEKN